MPFLLQGQLFNDSKKTELSDHFFGLSYFPASWQSSVFEEDLYTSRSYQQEVQFNKLSNALRLNYSGAEKMLVQFKEDFPNAVEQRQLIWMLPIITFKMKNIGMP